MKHRSHIALSLFLSALLIALIAWGISACARPAADPGVQVAPPSNELAALYAPADASGMETAALAAEPVSASPASEPAVQAAARAEQPGAADTPPQVEQAQAGTARWAWLAQTRAGGDATAPLQPLSAAQSPSAQAHPALAEAPWAGTIEGDVQSGAGALSVAPTLSGEPSAAFAAAMSLADGDERFVLDLAYNIMYGWVDAGDTVTLTRTSGGAAYGAAEADGVGFFWTPLWQPDGWPAEVAPGDTLEVFVNGALETALTPTSVEAHMDVLADQVLGSISGVAAGTPVTVALSRWATQPLTDMPQAVALTDASGAFTATFSADLGPHNLAQVTYSTGQALVRGYAYPQRVFSVDSHSWVFGYTEPGAPVTVTVYYTESDTVRSQATTRGNWPHGDYATTQEMMPHDRVEVDLGSGAPLTFTIGELNAYIDLDADRVTGGGCPPYAPVRVWAENWRLGRYREETTTADMHGVYTVTFSGFDLRASDAVYPACADSEGDEEMLSTNGPNMQVFPERDAVSGSGDLPNVPFTFTLQHPGEAPYAVLTGLTQYGWNGTGPVDVGEDIVPGDVITLETATWSGSMTVADISVTFDTAHDRVLGQVDVPGWVLAYASQWQDWGYPVNGGQGVSVTAASPFTATFTNFDVRDTVAAQILHYDENDFVTRLSREARYFQVEMPSGVGMPQLSPDEVLTATLYESDGQTIKHQTSEDRDPDNPDWYWLDLAGHIVAGDWITVTDGAGWTAGLQVPLLTMDADESANFLWGEGPKALLWLEWADFGRFVPSDGYIVDTAALGHDLTFGDWAVATYQARGGDLVRRQMQWPQLVAA
ncbi:MAG: hypothetical protein GX601_09910, partial [Anaerolineales bacterium]|nr:hypothetical protein [Anaerolineales bacterium]